MQDQMNFIMNFWQSFVLCIALKKIILWRRNEETASQILNASFYILLLVSKCKKAEIEKNVCSRNLLTQNVTRLAFFGGEREDIYHGVASLIPLIRHFYFFYFDLMYSEYTMFRDQTYITVCCRVVGLAQSRQVKRLSKLLRIEAPGSTH